MGESVPEREREKERERDTETERERARPFDKMTSGVKPVIFREFDVSNNESSTSCLILFKSSQQ